MCEEEPGCVLEDGATRIFLNTRGTNDDEVSEELAEFLPIEEIADALEETEAVIQELIKEMQA